jgi:hypothetical protein
MGSTIFIPYTCSVHSQFLFSSHSPIKFQTSAPFSDFREIPTEAFLISFP